MKIEIKDLVPKGYKIESFDVKTQTLNLIVELKNTREMFNTTDDILKYHSKTQESFTKECEGLSNSEIGFKWERMIARAYNLGVDIDLNEIRYYPYFYLGDNFRFFYSHWSISYSTVTASLCFKNKADLEDAVIKFIDVYKLSRTSAD